MKPERANSTLTLSLNTSALPTETKECIDAINNGKPPSEYSFAFHRHLFHEFLRATTYIKEVNSQPIEFSWTTGTLSNDESFEVKRRKEENEGAARASKFFNELKIKDENFRLFILGLLGQSSDEGKGVTNLIHNIQSSLGGQFLDHKEKPGRYNLELHTISVVKKTDTSIEISITSHVKEKLSNLNEGITGSDEKSNPITLELKSTVSPNGEKYQVKIEQVNFTFPAKNDRDEFADYVKEIHALKPSFYHIDIYQEELAKLGKDNWCKLLGLKNKEHLPLILKQLFNKSKSEDIDAFVKIIKELTQRNTSFYDLIQTLNKPTYSKNKLIQTMLEAPLLISRFEQVYDKNARKLTGLRRKNPALSADSGYTNNKPIPVFINKQYVSLQKEQDALLRNPLGLKYNWLEKIFTKPIDKLLLWIDRKWHSTSLSKISLKPAVINSAQAAISSQDEEQKDVVAQQGQQDSTGPLGLSRQSSQAAIIHGLQIDTHSDEETDDSYQSMNPVDQDYDLADEVNPADVPKDEEAKDEYSSSHRESLSYQGGDSVRSMSPEPEEHNLIEGYDPDDKPRDDTPGMGKKSGISL